MLIVDYNKVLQILIDNKEREDVINAILKLEYYFLPGSGENLEVMRKGEE